MTSTQQSTGVDVTAYVDLALEHLSDVTATLDAICGRPFSLYAVLLTTVNGPPARSHAYTTGASALGRFLLYLPGFRQRGVERESFDQARYNGGYVPHDLPSAHFQAYGTEDDEGSSWLASLVSWLVEIL
ncbi:hypothetical protein PAXINDRAFT_157989 [Paxillus involutus ATCC 200175]|uniref:Uncharacterized protein n=1 Tax=Paxillus involutus ATCC 200175 TaxID=664439 RepID=A0A0C9SPK2_PAXIN|nr:hypothetical protein PAXINDRAFT_157989 [Paxillus involutus ATCC 200175]